MAVKSYLASVRLFGEFLADRGMPSAPEAISRKHVEEFLTDQLRRWKLATAQTHYKGIRAFFVWLLEEGEISASPMARIKPPQVPEQPPEVLSDDELRRLLKTCEGKDFDCRRDMAILRLLIDTGLRRAELAGFKLADVDLDLNVAAVVGKGSRPRAVPFGRKTAVAIDRYLRVRGHHLDADRPKLKAGGQEGDLMCLAGWKSRTMLSRYGAAEADRRARDVYRRLSPGDRL
jgi:site-specific recombinase XerD